jgi:hypothetical protein
MNNKEKHEQHENCGKESRKLPPATKSGTYTPGMTAMLKSEGMR